MASNVELMVFTIASIAIQCLAMNVTVLRSEQDRFQTLPRNCSLCFAYKGVCTARHLPCQCPKERPTFVVNRKACISAATLTKENSCLTRQDVRNDILSFIDPPLSPSWFEFNLSDSFTSACTQRRQEIHFLDAFGWKLGSVDEVFTVNHISNGSNTLSLKVKNISSVQVFAGRIIRVDIICSDNDRRTTGSCALFKLKGNLSHISLPPLPSTAGIPVTKPSRNPHLTKFTFAAPTVDKAITRYSHSEPTNQASWNRTTEDLESRQAVSIDHDDDEDDQMSLLIPAITTILCILIVCIFAFFIVRYRRSFRQRSASDTPAGDLVVENGNRQGVIAMSNVPGSESEPVYSEVPDVMERANGKRFFSSISSLNTIIEDPFMVRNQSAYNTLPKARKNTDPLPVLPVRPPPVRPRTPDHLVPFRSTSDHPWNTKTAKFLNEVNRRGCMSLSRDKSGIVGRQRSSTDVDTLDDVFFETILSKRAVNNNNTNNNDGDDDDGCDHGHNSNSSFCRICVGNVCDSGCCEDAVDAVGRVSCDDSRCCISDESSCGSDDGIGDGDCVCEGCNNNNSNDCCGNDGSTSGCDDCGGVSTKKQCRQRSESFYQELHSNHGSKVSLYESLQEATKESPKTRHSTLERINKKNGYRNHGFTLQDELDPEYFTLEPPNEDENCSLPESDSLSCDEDGLDCSGVPEYHILEGPAEMQQKVPPASKQAKEQHKELTFGDESHSERGSLKRDNLQGDSSNRDNMKASLKKESPLNEDFIQTCNKCLYPDKDINGTLKGSNLKRNIFGEFECPYMDRGVRERTTNLESLRLHQDLTEQSRDSPSLQENRKTLKNNDSNNDSRDDSLLKDGHIHIYCPSINLTRSFSDSHLNYNLPRSQKTADKRKST